MKFHETSEIIFNLKNLWNFLPLGLIDKAFHS